MKEYLGKIMVFLVLLSITTEAKSYGIDLDAFVSYQRGNTFNTVIGSNASFKTKHISVIGLCLYSDNNVKIDKQYEVRGNADYPLYGQLEVFAFAVFGMDSKRYLDNYNKEILGLGYKMFNIKYSIGVGRNHENNKITFITTHRLKTNYEDKSYKLSAVSWYIKNPNDYDISIDVTLKRKLTKILHVGLGIKYSYDSSPIKSTVRGDFLSKFIVGVSL